MDSRGGSRWRIFRRKMFLGLIAWASAIQCYVVGLVDLRKKAHLPELPNLVDTTLNEISTSVWRRCGHQLFRSRHSSLLTYLLAVKFAWLLTVNLVSVIPKLLGRDLTPPPATSSIKCFKWAVTGIWRQCREWARSAQSIASRETFTFTNTTYQ